MALLNVHNLKLAQLCSKEESRFTLNAILVTPQATVVTDGHQLLELTTPPDMKAENFPEVPGVGPATDDWKPFLLPAADALAIAKELPKKSTIPVLQCAAVAAEAPEEFVRIVTTDLERANPHTIRRPKGRFPDYERLMPRLENGEFAVSFNPALMVDVLKFVADWQGAKRGAGGHCTLTFSNNRNAIRIDANSDGQKLRGAIMPTRLEGVYPTDTTSGVIEQMQRTGHLNQTQRIAAEQGARERLTKLERQAAQLRDLLDPVPLPDWYEIIAEAVASLPGPGVIETPETPAELPATGDIIDSYELASALGIGLATLYKRVQKGKLPAPIATKPRMSWKRSEVLAA